MVYLTDDLNKEFFINNINQILNIKVDYHISNDDLNELINDVLD